MAGKDYDVVKEAASRDGASRRPTTETRGARAQLLATNVLLIAHVRFVATTKVCVSKLHLSRAGSVRRSAPGRPFLKHTQELLGSTPGVVYERLVSFTTFQTLCTRGLPYQVSSRECPPRVCLPPGLQTRSARRARHAHTRERESLRVPIVRFFGPSVHFGVRVPKKNQAAPAGLALGPLLAQRAFRTLLPEKYPSASAAWRWGRSNGLQHPRAAASAARTVRLIPFLKVCNVRSHRHAFPRRQR